ncbi:MAG: hypothetical protein COV44_11310 [Deltaproteobacteria bacterium CG11_big_fil_rev_8_21_14_0_20_45_16]|nr:MAG: hypothetical protein COV44_11310 [Deltaproteobacteria bacterium CG11_big_fil_rev_8_21_14_0_20_45_16]
MYSRNLFKINWMLAVVIILKIQTIYARQDYWDVDYQIKVEKSQLDEIVIDFTLEKYLQSYIEIYGELYPEIFVQGATTQDIEGMPAIPRIAQDIMVPISSEDVSVEIISIMEQRISSRPPAPSRGSLMRNQDVSRIPFKFSSVYRSREVYPSAWYEVGNIVKMRDIKLSNLRLYPVRFDFATNELIQLKHLKLRLKFKHSRVKQWLGHSKYMNYQFANLYRDHVINFPASLRFDSEEEALLDNGRLLILSPLKFYGELDEFIRWKKQRGFDVSVEYLGTDELRSDFIANKIKDDYQARSASNVLLIGDAEDMPYKEGVSGNAAGNEADPLYATVDGNDNYPDLFVSRISVEEVSELRTVLRKSIDYESRPELGTDWYSKAVGIGSDEGAWSGLKDSERVELLRGLLLGWHYSAVDQVYDPSASKINLRDAINEGRGFLNYIGHGWESGWVTSNFDNNDVLGLQNSGRWPFIVSVACVNGHFAYDYGDSFAEAWLKAGTEEDPRGAVSIFASSTNQSWVPPTVGQKRIVELMTENKNNSIGSLFFNGSIAVLEDKSTSADQTFETWHIFGDSSLQIRTRTPQAINLNSFLPYEVESNRWKIALGVLEPGISVAVMKGDIQIGRGLTNEQGQLIMELNDSSLRSDQSLEVFLTGFNKIPRREQFRLP